MYCTDQNMVAAIRSQQPLSEGATHVIQTHDRCDVELFGVNIATLLYRGGVITLNTKPRTEITRSRLNAILSAFTTNGEGRGIGPDWTWRNGLILPPTLTLPLLIR